MDVISFYRQIPDTITVNRNWSCRPGDEKNAWKKPYLVQPATVNSVKDALVRGPFVAISAVGPGCYSDKPTQFNGLLPGHDDVSIYGWKSGARRISEKAVPIIVCGVQRREGIEQIYYVLAQDVSEDPNEAIGKFRPSSTDLKVYGASMRMFADSEFDMFPPVSQEEIAEYRSQSVVPTIFAGRPDLLQLVQSGKITVSCVGTPQN